MASGPPTLSEGDSIGGWTLGTKLGQGAFGAVFEATNPAEPGQWAIKLATLRPSRGKKRLTTQSHAAVGLSTERRMYQVTLRKASPHLPAVPKRACFGDEGDHRYLVMQKLGTSLSAKMKAIAGPIPTGTVAAVGVQVLECLRVAHQKATLYVDLKPDNVMLGTGSSAQENHVYLVDWGSAVKYITSSGAFLPSPLAAGNDMYRSLYATDGASPAPRDDLAAMAYMLVHMATGTLPWMGSDSAEALIATKKATSVADLCAGLPAFLRQFVEATTSMELDDARGVDYDALVGMLRPHASASLVWEGGAGGGGGAGAGVGAGARGGSRTKAKAKATAKAKVTKSTAKPKKTTRPKSKATPKPVVVEESEEEQEQEEKEEEKAPSPPPAKPLRTRTVRKPRRVPSPVVVESDEEVNAENVPPARRHTSRLKRRAKSTPKPAAPAAAPAKPLKRRRVTTAAAPAAAAATPSSPSTPTPAPSPPLTRSRVDGQRAALPKFGVAVAVGAGLYSIARMLH